MSSPGVIEALVRIVGDALSTIGAALQGDKAETLLEELGLRLPDGTLTTGSVQQTLQAAASACAVLPAAIAALDDAISHGDDGAMLTAAFQIGERIVEAGAAFGQLGTAIDNVVQGTAGLSPAQKVRLSGVAAALPSRLLHLALITWVEDRHPTLKGALEIAGLFDDSLVTADPADPSLPAYRDKQVRFDRLSGLLTDPGRHLSDLYRFGLGTFDGIELFGRVKQLVDRPDAEAILIVVPGQPAVLEAFFFRMAVAPGAVPGLGLRLRVSAERDLNLTVPVTELWSATATSAARFQSGIEFLLDPQTGFRIEPPTADASVDASFGFVAERGDGSPMVVIGQAGGSRVEVKRFAVRIPVRLSTSAGALSPNVTLGAELEVKDGRVVVDTSHADSFMATILGGIDVESPFDLNAQFDDRGGLRFTGSATVVIAIPTHISLGPVSISTVYLIGGFEGGGAVVAEFSADLGAQLGPLAVSVSRLGAGARITFPPGGGNAGAAQMDVSFKAPNGVGLAIDAGLLRGGGFLYVDAERGEYAGAIQFTVAEVLGLSAIGLISTRLPDGSSGFSLLIIITADFGPGIQLGFGFTLLAVGGLIGLNRVVLFQPLMDGVRTGAIDGIMFPRDVVANAPRIISDLRAIFPPQEGTFLIGPMAKLGWGEPTLVRLSLGVVIEIPPGDIAILGVLRIALPAEDVAIAVFQVNFAGALEFSKQRAYFFAALFDSHVLFLTLDGEMGLLFAWGDNANFVVSIGGFHPRFNPPPLPFPAPKRISVDIINESYARIHCDGYFALTTNTLQFGSHSDYYFGFSACNVSGHSGFDALVQFSPFHFVVDISTAFSVEVFGIGMYGIDMDLTVEGPTPWHVHGSASLSFLFFSISIPVDLSFGDARDTQLPPVAVLPIVSGELGKASNWKAAPPPGSNLLVALRSMSADEARLVMHPLGALQVSQRAIPLDLTLDKVGSQRPSDANRFAVSVVSASMVKTRNLEESFAPAQFKNFDDATKLSEPAYAPQDGGLELAAAAQTYASGTAVCRVVRYDVTIVDTKLRRVFRRFVHLAGSLFEHGLRRNAAAKSVLSAARQAQTRPFDESVKVTAEKFTVANVADNTVFHPDAAAFSSRVSARDFIERATAADPTLAGTLHVVPHFEVAA